MRRSASRLEALDDRRVDLRPAGVLEERVTLSRLRGALAGSAKPAQERIECAFEAPSTSGQRRHVQVERNGRRAGLERARSQVPL